MSERIHYVGIAVIIFVLFSLARNCNRQPNASFPSYELDEVLYDNSYGAADYALFDLYRPRLDISALPCVILFHPGAFIMGDKENRVIVYLAEQLAEAGYVVIAGNYNLIDANEYSLFTETPKDFVKGEIFSAFSDGKCLINHVINNAENLGVDSNKLFVGGFSAGGFIALNAFFGDNREMEIYFESSLDEVTTCSINDELVRKHIRGVFSVGGGVFDRSHIDKSDISRRDVPQVLVMQGGRDEIVPPGCGKVFTEWMRRKTKVSNHELWSALMGEFFGSDQKIGRKVMNRWAEGVILEILQSVQGFFIPEVCGSRVVAEEMDNREILYRRAYFRKKGHVPVVYKDGSLDLTIQKRVVENILSFLATLN